MATSWCGSLGPRLDSTSSRDSRGVSPNTCCWLTQKAWWVTVGDGDEKGERGGMNGDILIEVQLYSSLSLCCPLHTCNHTPQWCHGVLNMTTVLSSSHWGSANAREWMNGWLDECTMALVFKHAFHYYFMSYILGPYKRPSVWKCEPPDQLPHGQQTPHRVSWQWSVSATASRAQGLNSHTQLHVDETLPKIHTHLFSNATQEPCLHMLI